MNEMKIFVDSGAYSLQIKYIRDKKTKDKLAFYKSKDFWEFVDSYAKFIKENKHLIETYVNVDIPFYPEFTWKVQKYLEDIHKLQPLPVFHIFEDFDWLKKYIDNYGYIAISGTAKFVSKSAWMVHIGDPAFNLICDDKGMPRVKVHGLALTSPDLVIDFPIFSADSTSWMQFGKYGLIIIPKKRNGKFIYNESPHIIKVSSRKKSKTDYENFINLSPMIQKQIIEYLESINLKMGKSNLEAVDFDKTKYEIPVSDKEVSSKEIVIEKGVCNDNDSRDQANLQYYLDLEANIPPWPRPWKRKRKGMLTRLPIP